jgi:hypothetical protein
VNNLTVLCDDLYGFFIKRIRTYDGGFEHATQKRKEAVVAVEQQQIQLSADGDALHVHLHEQRVLSMATAASPARRNIRRRRQGAPKKRFDRSVDG